jgi:hypothetical protein
MKTKNIRKSITQIVIVSLLSEGILLLLFKKIRSFIPVPEIGEDKMVGFPQYYGYPIYYDTIYFLVLFILPILITVIIYRKNSKK